MGITLSESQFLLVLILTKVGVMASLATWLVRFGAFKKTLLAGESTARARLVLPLILGLLLMAGVCLRLLVRYSAVDLSLEGSFLIGMLAGPAAGATAGLLASAPAFAAGEFLALPVNLFAGALAGGLRTLCPNRDALWNFSPFPLMNLGRFFKAWLRLKRLDWNMVFLFACLAVDGLRLWLASRYPGLIFGFHPPGFILLVCVLYSTVLCLGIPIKILNNTRIEIQLREQNALLLQARYEALRRQINPHFLFNTLNSISSSIRTAPENARTAIVKLSQMFRTLLEQKQELVPLSEELKFIDSYLTIQAIRYGEEKLRIVREIDPATLDIRIPSMILQPIVENAFQHGLSKTVGPGRLAIRSRLEGENAVIEIENDGPGIREEEFQEAMKRGIGIQNVRERLQVIYGRDSLFRIESLPEEASHGNPGTRVTRATVTLPAAHGSAVERQR
jgi:two-component system LytT family sensor kinase